MSLIKQMCRKNSRSVDVEMSAGDQAILVELMEGVVTVYDEKFTGGTDIPTPATLRHVRLGVNRKLDKLSCTVNIKHVKPTKSLNELLAEKGLFDANYDSPLTATGMRCVYEGSM